MLSIKNSNGRTLYSLVDNPKPPYTDRLPPIPKLPCSHRSKVDEDDVQAILDVYMRAASHFASDSFIVRFDEESLLHDLYHWVRSTA